MAIGPISGLNFNGANVQTSPSSDSTAQETSTTYAKVQDKGNYDFSKAKQPSESTIKEVVTKVNNQMKLSNTRCEFNYNEKINRVSIKIIDNDTDEIVKEIPPEQALEMVEKMWELAGLLVDEKR